MLHGYVQQLGLMVQELRNHGKVVVGIPETSPNIIIHDLGLGEASMYLMIFYDFLLLAPSYFDIVLDIYTQIIGIESA